ncbi:hypothetical protein Goshw_011859 [Gossypium schwendimanii]|uniref:Uncharacterized protein n=1 Tax=Gossypium schwendimanii TaxID=34291 RepID=A0A7J9L9C6_GOSSC|nr:hypothetical protein [Gossypium schwendimanii]
MWPIFAPLQLVLQKHLLL